MGASVLRIEVAFALPDRQSLIALEVEEGCTVYTAALRSGIAARHPELDLDCADYGVFGRVVTNPREERVKAGDRVEIYRPLIADPKEIRRARAAGRSGKAGV